MEVNFFHPVVVKTLTSFLSSQYLEFNLTKTKQYVKLQRRLTSHRQYRTMSVRKQGVYKSLKDNTGSDPKLLFVFRSVPQIIVTIYSLFSVWLFLYLLISSTKSLTTNDNPFILFLLTLALFRPTTLHPSHFDL